MSIAVVLKLRTTSECCKANYKYIVGSLPDISLESMGNSATAAFQEFVMDPANADRAQTPNNQLAALGLTGALGFTARHMAYV